MLNVPFFSQYQNFNVINFFLLLQFLDLNIQIINYLLYTTIIPILRSASIIRKMDLLTKNNSIYRTLADSSRSNPLFQTTTTHHFVFEPCNSISCLYPDKIRRPTITREHKRQRTIHFIPALYKLLYYHLPSLLRIRVVLSLSFFLPLLSSFSHVPRRCVPRANSVRLIPYEKLRNKE